jgi:murein DD-endopeptidase MepM/ murein hydrolase activator NlpD
VLTCPTPSAPLHLEVEARSLYLLYAHLLEPPEVMSGEALACGASLGAVGMSGNALNPHLHLEVRVGPSGIRFESLAHYTASASPQEMGDYCLWRVSGAFQPSIRWLYSWGWNPDLRQKNGVFAGVHSTQANTPDHP